MKNFWQSFLKYVLVILGGAIVGIGVGWILLPLKISTGGFSGLATILFYVYKIPANIGVVLLNVPIFLIGIKVLGFKYTWKSLIAMLTESITLTLIESWEPLTNDILLSAIFGGVAVGIGVALAIKGEGTTGGTDLVAKIVHKRRPFLNLSQIVLAVDAGIIITSAIVFRDIDIALYSIVAVFVMSKMMDVILEGVDYSKAMFIISDKSEEIADYIMKEVGRGVTSLKGEGMYTKSDKNVLMCVINKNEIPKIKLKVKLLDDKAFIIVTSVTEAIGEGFAA